MARVQSPPIRWKSVLMRGQCGASFFPAGSFLCLCWLVVTAVPSSERFGSTVMIHQDSWCVCYNKSKRTQKYPIRMHGLLTSHEPSYPIQMWKFEHLEYLRSPWSKWENLENLNISNVLRYQWSKWGKFNIGDPNEENIKHLIQMWRNCHLSIFSQIFNIPAGPCGIL